MKFSILVQTVSESVQQDGSTAMRMLPAAKAMVQPERCTRGANWLHEIECVLVTPVARRGRGSVRSACFHERERTSTLPSPQSGEYVLLFFFEVFSKRRNLAFMECCVSCPLDNVLSEM